MKALLSIKPEFALQIFSGQKKFEYRRKIFKKTVDSVIVYATSPMKLVIGEFFIDDILFEEVDKLWERTKTFSGISKEYYYKYFENLDRGYAIKIGNVNYFEVSFSITEKYGIIAPQCFAYV